MKKVLLLAAVFGSAPQRAPPSGPLEIRVYILDEHRKPLDLKGSSAFLEIGDRLDGTEREVVPMVWTVPRGSDRIEGRHEGQIRPIEGETWVAEMVVIHPPIPDPAQEGDPQAGPYFKAEYMPGDRIRPAWTASVTIVVKGEPKTARNFRYPFVEVTRAGGPGARARSTASSGPGRRSADPGSRFLAS